MQLFLLLLGLLFAFGNIHAQRYFELTYLPSAKEKGAVCLDGSAPGYYYRAGTTEPKKWIIFMEGGGWCNTPQLCVERSLGPLGSSFSWPDTTLLPGMLSDNCDKNPEFCGWTMTHIPYCDGGSFSGNVDEPVVVETDSGSFTIYYRGFRLLDAVTDAIIERGAGSADMVVLAGCSAGGLSVYHHLDFIKQKIPNVPVYGFADSGYFLNIDSVAGPNLIQFVFKGLVKMQNVSAGLDPDCVAAYPKQQDLWKCWIPEFNFQYIQTPIFVLNSVYDRLQMCYFYGLPCLPPECNRIEMTFFRDFGKTFREKSTQVLESPSSGYYFSTCIDHCYTEGVTSWNDPIVEDQTIGQTLLAWLTNSTTLKSQVEDQGEYTSDGSNPTCSCQQNPTRGCARCEM